MDEPTSPDLVDTVQRKLTTVDSFSSLTASCEGAFPAKIVEVLHHLSPKITAASERLSEAARYERRRPFSDPRLPLPHPLDFEWRFSNASIDKLLNRMNEIAGVTDKLLFVCTPAAALRAFDLVNSRRLIYASRLDDPVTESLKIACSERMEFVEVRDDLSWIGASAALVDPPWYDDIALPLVGQALQGLKQGGGVFVCIPDRLSGCSAAPMLSSIVENSAPFGLNRAYLAPGKLRYETPYFEINTLHHLGLFSVHPQWRTGQVAFGRKTGASLGAYDFPVESKWREIGNGRGWRARFRQPARAQVSTCGAMGFDVRKTISRTGGDVQLAEGWTVGNRVTSTASHISTIEFDHPAAATIRQIADVEHREAQRFIDQEAPKFAMEKWPIMLPVRKRAIYSVEKAI
jgi:hypothetical protein